MKRGGNRAHRHPPLKAPRSLFRRTISQGKYLKEKIATEENDNGKIANGRVYTYHPTKGWRNRSLKIVSSWASIQMALNKEIKFN